MPSGRRKRGLLLLIFLLTSSVSAFLAAEWVRSRWVCDEFTWAWTEGSGRTALSHERMLFFNRGRVLLQMTDGPNGLRPNTNVRWRRVPSFDPGKHLNWWRRYGVSYLPGPMNRPPSVEDRVLTFPLALPLLLTSIPAFLSGRAFLRLRRRRRRALRGWCLHCGYDLAGNISGTCPECGARVLVITQLRSEAASGAE